MQKQPPIEFYKKVVLKHFPIFTGKHLFWSLFIKKLQGFMFSCEYCEILKNTYFQEHLRTTTFLYGAVAHDSQARNQEFFRAGEVSWN